MIRISNLKLSPDHTREQLVRKIAASLRIPEREIRSWRIVRRSLDARKKPELFYLYQIDVQTAREERVVRRLNCPDIVLREKEPAFVLPHGEEPMRGRPAVIGFGPAGMFCGYLLAKEGYAPVIFERGGPAGEREEAVERFWRTGLLDPECNVQFGEGGAGMFSDGKLNTLVKDPNGRNRRVLELFVQMGADPEILWENRPHIGTDRLKEITVRFRREIIRLGGEVRFHRRVSGFETEGGILRGLKISGPDGKEEIWETKTAVLAVGHSARDTFPVLLNAGVRMRQKPFAVGLRIQHPQEMINRSQYGEACPYRLPPASYRLAERASDGRGVYTFCMCPGGYVVNASSEAGRTAVNGMSFHDRSGTNANSAVIVTVDAADFGSGDILAGMEYQRRLEEAAFRAGQGAIPVQLFGDYRQGRTGSGFGAVSPAFKGAFRFANLREVLTEPVGNALEEGILAFSRRIAGFADSEAVLAGVESRTSAPVRVDRDERLESSVRGLYPCGEGAGYAGGITSAAMDGLKTAETIIRRFRAGG